MTPERRSQVAEIGRGALARGEQSREAFLQAACRDDRALRAEVDAFLGATLPAADPETPTTSFDTADQSAIADLNRSGTAHPEAVLAAAGRSDHYRVVSRIGIGGMGVVYKAIDTRLDRAVAIKAILRDPGMKDGAARLRKEAMAAASLDHPYICKVYELIETSHEHLIVMEFVEGETLSQRLRRGIPPLTTSLSMAIEIAEGLAVAHDRGIVHRDLKPGNVMVTSHEHIKLLDFGLARAGATSTATADTESLTHQTDPHAGTPYYMAPEQAEGRAITSRADLFALGVVLFECVTGVRPFEGANRSDYLHHVRFEPPRSVRRLAPEVPEDLAALIERCLEKSPVRRPESAKQIVQDLRRIAAALSASGNSAPAISRPRGLPRWFAAAVLATTLIVGALAWRVFLSRPEDVALWRSRPFATSSSEESSSRISPDKQWISYLSDAGGTTQLLVRRLDGGEPHRVAVPAGTLMDQLWSPDGSQLAYVLRQKSEASLQIVPAFFGGTPTQRVPLEPLPTGVRMLRWIGQTIYVEVVSARGIDSVVRLDLQGGTSTNITAGWSIKGSIRGIDVSPDARRVIYMVWSEGQEDLWVANLDGSSARRLTNDQFLERYPLWSGHGRSVLYQSNRGGLIDLWELSPDSGRSWPLTSSVTVEEPESTSSDGMLVSFRQTSEDADLWLWDPSDKTPRQLTDDALADFAPTAAAGGLVLAFQRRHPTPILTGPTDSALHVIGLAPGAGSSLPAVTNGFAPRLSPDGAWLAYLQNGHEPESPLLISHVETHETITVSRESPRPSYSEFPIEWAGHNVAWNRSSTELYFVDATAGRSIRRYRLGAKPAADSLVAAEPGRLLRDLHPSEDGRSLAFLESSGNSSTLKLCDLVSGTVKSTATFTGSVYIRGWLPDNSGVVLVRAARFHEDFTADVDVIVVSGAGQPTPLGVIERAQIATSRLDSARSLLYVTRSEAGIHNLYAFSLTGKTLRRITDNALTGVTFSGAEPLATGAVVGARSERKVDTWLLESTKP